MIGETLRHYTFLASLGSGGMGEVYRARDTRLGRDVAIKVLSDRVLPGALAEGAVGGALVDLEREARLLASVNHPNIATVHGYEEVDGRSLLVMELVSGTTLHEQMARGSLPLWEVLEIFTQLAAALEAAHLAGVVHRDLKPSNVQLATDGVVKVLDFGLARLDRPVLERAPGMQPAGAHPESSSQPSDEAGEPDPTAATVTDTATWTGRLVGTLPYMSPEQVRGLTVDRQGDVWSFACCLFEALAGRTPFSGNTPSDTLANILRGEPDWERLPKHLPARLRRLLERCLAKERSERQRDMGDVWLELREARAEESSPGDASWPGPGVSPSTISPFLLFVLAVALVLVGFVLARALNEREKALEPPSGQSEPTIERQESGDADEYLEIRVPRSQLEALLEDGREPAVLPVREPSDLERPAPGPGPGGRDATSPPNRR